MLANIESVITKANAVALGTTGPHGVNVVPLSVVELRGGEIYLYDFFMRKTAENIKTESRVALTCWQGFRGVQVQADAAYESAGEEFEKAKQEMKERFPNRNLKGLIRLTPVAVYDVAPGSIGDNLLQ